MLKRILTSIVGLPLLVLFVCLGGIALKTVVLILALIGMYEVFAAVSKDFKIVHVPGYIAAAAYIALMDIVDTGILAQVILFALTPALLTLLVLGYKHINIIDCTVTLLGFFYVAALLSVIYFVRESQYGLYYVWLVFISAWGSDTGALFTGISIGRHKLTALSPRKTVEGSFGGILAAGLLSLLYGFILERFFRVSGFSPMLVCCLAGVLGACFSQIGDLTASAIKRYTGIKDYGKILPGHGGIIDRFDSVLFAAPAVYLILTVLGSL